MELDKSCITFPFYVDKITRVWRLVCVKTYCKHRCKLTPLSVSFKELNTTSCRFNVDTILSGLNILKYGFLDSFDIPYSYTVYNCV